MQYIDTFEIPIEIAKELSTLTGKEKIRKDLLLSSINNEEVFNRIEKELIVIMEQLECMKQKITDEYVPDKYRSEKYSWMYNGWEIDKNNVGIVNSSDIR